MDRLFLTVKPFFILAFKFIIVFSLSIGILLLLLIPFLPFILLEENRFMVNMSILCALMVDVIVIIFVLLSDYLNYNATIYKVFDDRIEFEEGFINHKYATLKWIDIKEIHFTQNFLQRMFGIGHIKFITAANTGYNGYNDGIKFRDIQKPKEIYDKLKRLHSSIHA